MIHHESKYRKGINKRRKAKKGNIEYVIGN